MNGTVAILPNELALVARAVAEPAAFAAIYDHYFSRVYNYVRFRVGDAAISDDLTATIFERTLKNLASFQQERGPFGAWLFAIARNAVNDHLRRHTRWKWLSLDALQASPSPNPGPEQALIEAENRAQLLLALSDLSARERDLLALKFAAGLSNLRIADLTGLSQSHVGVLIYRAVQRLRTSLQEKQAEEVHERK